MNTAQFGALYAGATLASAASLPFFGRLLDRVTLRAFSLAVGLGLVAACFAMALAPNVFVLFIQRPSRRLDLLRDPRLYWLLPGNLFLPVVLTALFLYQIPLAESRGWSAQTMAAAFIGFAVARMAASLIVGPLIDRWGAVRLFPVILIPACVGLGALSLGPSPWIAFIYLALAGVSQGIASPMMTALWAEVYGVETLGATKSTVSMLGIFATALGPVVLGGLLKAGVSFTVILPGCVGLGVVAIGISLLARLRLRVPE